MSVEPCKTKSTMFRLLGFYTSFKVKHDHVGNHTSIVSRAYVVLSLNGQGIYLTWTLVASLINFSHCLRYVADMKMETVSAVALGTLLTIVLIYFVLENTILDNYIRLLLTPYFGNWNSQS